MDRLTQSQSIAVSQIEEREYDCSEKDFALNHKLSKSLRLFGQLKNVVVRQISENTYKVVDGQKILRELKALGENYISCTICQAKTDDEAALLYLVLNEYSYLRDYTEVASLLKKLHESIDKAHATSLLPYTTDELDQLLDMANFTFDELKKTPIPNQQSLF